MTENHTPGPPDLLAAAKAASQALIQTEPYLEFQTVRRRLNAEAAMLLSAAIQKAEQL